MRVAERIIETEGRIEGERVAMSIDTSALQHIMSVLTDLYSDPEAAVIREYSTNALDSHIEAGQSRPIEVTTPTQLMPFLRIRDYGVGLDAEGIRSIYSQYGTSTKRDSDDVVGMLGLGCKSALTYCDQFTLVGYKDGTMTTVAVGRDEDGSGSMVIVDVSDTDEPNGLEVVIPAKRDNDLAEKAAAFFGHWSEGTVLLNGEAPTPHKLTWIVPDRIGVSTELDEHVVVMGNVAYPVGDLGSGITNLNGGHAVFRVDIGEVNFTPSREALQATKRTRETMAALVTLLNDEYHKGLAKAVADAPTNREAILAFQEAHRLGLPQAKALWRGREVVTHLDRTPLDAQGNRQRYARPDDTTHSWLLANARGVGGRGYNRFRKTGDRTWSVAIVTTASQYDPKFGGYRNTVVPSVFFDGFDGKALTDTRRAKIEQYLGITAQTPDQRWVFADKLTPVEVAALDGTQIVKWANVEAIKLASSASKLVTKKLAGSYPGVRPDGNGRVVTEREIAASDINGDKVLWLPGSYWQARTALYDTYNIPKDYWIIALSANRVEKFKRDFPKAQLMSEWVKTNADREWAALPREQRLAGANLYLSGNYRARGLPSWLKHMTVGVDTLIDDALAIFNTKSDQARVKLEAYYNITHTLPAEVKEVTGLTDKLAKKYPLLVNIHGVAAGADHIVKYVNAVA